MPKNRRSVIFIGFILLVFSSMACSLSGLIPGTSSGGGGTVSDLWPDVPKMDGMTPLKEDLPLEARVMVQTFFATASDNQGTLNFIAYSTSNSITDVVNFYSVDRMQSAGWNSTEQLGCTADTSSSSNQSGFCMFAKEMGNNSGALLAIIPSMDSTTKKTTIFFARVDIKNLKTATPKP